MSSNLDVAGQAVCMHLIAAEKAGDAMVHDTAALNMTIIEARRMTNVRASTGQRAMSDIARAHELGTEARALLVRAHERLAAEATALGLDWTMWGDEATTPKVSIENRPAESEVIVAEAD